MRGGGVSRRWANTALWEANEDWAHKEWGTRRRRRRRIAGPRPNQGQQPHSKGTDERRNERTKEGNQHCLAPDPARCERGYSKSKFGLTRRVLPSAERFKPLQTGPFQTFTLKAIAWSRGAACPTTPRADSNPPADPLP